MVESGCTSATMSSGSPMNSWLFMPALRSRVCLSVPPIPSAGLFKIQLGSCINFKISHCPIMPISHPEDSKTVPRQYTAGHEGAVGVISCMSIFSACFGLLTSVQLAATTCTCQIWISGWILPHFDVRTISVA